MTDRIRCEGSLVEVSKGTEIYADAKEPRAVCPKCNGRVGLTPASEKFPAVRYGTHYVRPRKAAETARVGVGGVVTELTAQGRTRAATLAATTTTKKNGTSADSKVSLTLTPTGHRLIVEQLSGLGSPELAAAKKAPTKTLHGYKRISFELSTATANEVAKLVSLATFASSTGQKAQKEVLSALAKALA